MKLNSQFPCVQLVRILCATRCHHLLNTVNIEYHRSFSRSFSVLLMTSRHTSSSFAKA
jgi:hypothetical protein